MSKVNGSSGTLAVLRLLPKNLLSRWAGRLAALPLARFLRAPMLGLFGRLAGVDFDEVRDPIDSFPSLQAFFTRALRDGARPIDPAEEAFVAPCDGAWGESGIVRDGLLLQLKGRPYSLAALLGDDALAADFEGGCFATFYLSPRDYHRFHVGCDVRVVGATYIPGTLWPVNRFGVAGVESLFARNERICALMEPIVAGEVLPGRLCMVAVGATLVGKIRLTFDDLTTNLRAARKTSRTYREPGIPLSKGAEWGRFEFGSTIVLLAVPGLLEIDACPPGTPLRMGRRIGSLLQGGAGLSS